jgi:xanthine dehydrogenase molybdopterin-binding subunit B
MTSCAKSKLRVFILSMTSHGHNPLIRQGQLEGVIIQELGFALCEEMEVDVGRVMASGLGDYKILSVRDVPPLVMSFVKAKVGFRAFFWQGIWRSGHQNCCPRNS